MMYVPAENVYYEIAVKDEPTGDEPVGAYALARKVIPVSPGCFYAYLQAIVLGLRGLRIEERAHEILQQLARLRGDFDRFREDFRVVGRHVTNAASSFAGADRRLERLDSGFAAITARLPARGNTLRSWTRQGSRREGGAHDQIVMRRVCGLLGRCWRRVGGVVLLAWLCLGMRATPAGGSVAAEQDLGTTFDMEARKELPLSDDVDVNRYVARVGQKIVAALGDQPFNYRFAVVRDGRINAFAVPGGSVYVNAGLLTAAGNDDEVAGVLAHEIAHVNGHHLVRQQEATQVLNYATLLGLLLSVVHPAIGAGAAAANSAVQLQYRREFEQEATTSGRAMCIRRGTSRAAWSTSSRRCSTSNGSGPRRCRRICCRIR